MFLLQNTLVCSRGKFFCEVPANPTDLGDTVTFLVMPEPPCLTQGCSKHSSRCLSMVQGGVFHKAYK